MSPMSDGGITDEIFQLERQYSLADLMIPGSQAEEIDQNPVPADLSSTPTTEGVRNALEAVTFDGVLDAVNLDTEALAAHGVHITNPREIEGDESARNEDNEVAQPPLPECNCF